MEETMKTYITTVDNDGNVNTKPMSESERIAIIRSNEDADFRQWTPDGSWGDGGFRKNEPPRFEQGEWP